jgi:hypothetical protein
MAATDTAPCPDATSDPTRAGLVVRQPPLKVRVAGDEVAPSVYEGLP